MPEPHLPPVGPAFSFDRFQILPRQRLLLEAGKPVRLGSRAFDILLALVERAGERIGKNELLARIWPDTHVVEGNLKVQMVALRRVLRDGQQGRRFIDTSPGQGYCFVAPVTVRKETEQPAPPVVDAQHHNLPEQLTPLIGRDGVVAKLIAQLTRCRLLTIVGSGGIGKTSVALAVAERLVDAYEDGVWVIDLSLIVDPDLVLAAVAGAVGVKANPGLTTQTLVAALRGRRMMLVLDNCEHLVDAAATLVSAILRGTPDIRVLATGREPLRTEGEHLCRLEPLETPPPSHDIRAADALRYSSVQLFVEQAAATLDVFQLTDGNAPFVSEICCKLDGIPLAIELAAARVQTLGVRELLARLQERLLLTAGFRTSLPRHRTLSAAIDWSYDLLPADARRVFRRLAVFTGGFPLQAAAVVAAEPNEPESDAMHLVADLVEKSLVVVSSRDAEPCFRLLDTTRAYALQKLAESGELRRIARCHAEYYRELFERAETELETRPVIAWLKDYEEQIENLRAALDWAFSADGASSIGIALTAAAVPLWMELSLVEEARHRIDQAFNAIDAGAEVNKYHEMKLSAALGASLIYTRNGDPEVAAIWKRALNIAESLENAEYQIHSLWGLWAFYVNGIQYDTALKLARRLAALTATHPDPTERLMGERMIATSYHFLGDQRSARCHIERTLGTPPVPDGKRQIVRLELEPWVTARVHLARILWLQGFPDRAMGAAEQSIEDARTARHAISLNYALHRGACPVALWVGDLLTADHYAGMLLDHAKKHVLGRWELYGRCYQAAVALRRGDVNTGLRMLTACFEELGSSGIAAPRFLRFAAVHMADALGQAGRVPNGLAAIDEAMARAEHTKELWELPEMMRIRGELLLLHGAFQNAVAAENCFRRALDVACRQGALSWELRSATSLARLLCGQERPHDAVAVLQPVFEKFTEGFDTADLKEAKALLGSIRLASLSPLPLV